MLFNNWATALLWPNWPKNLFVETKTPAGARVFVLVQGKAPRV